MRTAKPISRRTIARAAALCAIAASTPGMLLSYVAWGAVMLAGLGRGMTDAERWAAGEAYLRCRKVEALAASVREFVGEREVLLARHELRRLGVGGTS